MFQGMRNRSPKTNMVSIVVLIFDNPIYLGRVGKSPQKISETFKSPGENIAT